jgi:hypothetical protein
MPTIFAAVPCGCVVGTHPAVRSPASAGAIQQFVAISAAIVIKGVAKRGICPS